MPRGVYDNNLRSEEFKKNKGHVLTREERARGGRNSAEPRSKAYSMRKWIAEFLDADVKLKDGRRIATQEALKNALQNRLLDEKKGRAQDILKLIDLAGDFSGEKIKKVEITGVSAEKAAEFSKKILGE